jgi:hypothetical protein
MKPIIIAIVLTSVAASWLLLKAFPQDEVSADGYLDE